MPAQRRASISVVDRLPNPMARMGTHHSTAQSVDGKDAVGTAASTISGDSGSRSSNPTSPRRQRRRSLFQRTISKLTLNMLLDPEEDKEEKSQDGLLGASTGSITSFDMNDMEMTSFEMEMKARNLLTEVREMLKTQQDKEKELEFSIKRHTELALARSSGVGALISMKKVKKEQVQLQKVKSAIGYLDTQQMDLMMDIEEAKNKNIQNESYDWPVYEEFQTEVEIILSPTETKEAHWTDDQLMLELDQLRRVSRKNGSRKAARHHSMD